MRNEIEDFVLNRLRQVVPERVRLTVLADLGFGDQIGERDVALLGEPPAQLFLVLESPHHILRGNRSPHQAALTS